VMEGRGRVYIIDFQLVMIFLSFWNAFWPFCGIKN